MVKPELDANKDYYKALGITATCTQVDIRKAFLDLARTQHPDKNPGQETEYKAKFQNITTAYDVLKDPALKKTYDQIRPTIRRAPGKSTFSNATSSVPSTKTGFNTTSESARAGSFPRQAKNNNKSVPKSPPKKAPTARRDPFNGWTPPVPSAKPSTATPDAKSRASRPPYFENGQTPRNAKAGTQKTPTAAQSAFFNVSPSSPFRADHKTSAPTPTKSTPNVSAARSTAQPSKRPDWGTKETSWAKSSTAYSTFHAPSSKYSPYSQDHSNFAKSNATPGPAATKKSHKENIFEFTTTKPMATPSPSFPMGSNTFSAGGKKSSTEYDWQQSRSAYQRSETTAGSTSQYTQVPRKNPFGPDFKSGNPFFEKSASPKLDSDKMDDYSDDSSSDNSDDSSSTTQTKHRKSGHDSHNKQSQHFTSHAQASAYNGKIDDNDVRSTKPDLCSSTNVDDDDTRNPDHTTETRDESGSKPKLSKPFSFVFKHSPKSVSDGVRRTSAGIPPYVKFNPVPDLDFSSPSSKEGVDSMSPFSSSGKPAAPGQGFPVEDESRRKHVRGDDAPDPRFSPEVADKDGETDDLTTRFSTFGIRKSSSPVKTSLRFELRKKSNRQASAKSNTTQSTSDPAAGSAFGAPEAAEFTFCSPSPIKSASVEKEDFPSWSSAFCSRAPVIPEALTRPLTLDTLADNGASTEYIKNCEVFTSYLAEWTNYEKERSENLATLSLGHSESYTSSLSLHAKVLEAQAARINQYVQQTKREQ